MPLQAPLLAPVSLGELVDKITILRIKAQKLRRAEALDHVRVELKALENVLNNAQPTDHKQGTKFSLNDATFIDQCNSLQQINEQLWKVEDDLRLMEGVQRFDSTFVQLARSVYQLNDQRAAVKRDINLTHGSALIEEKSYGEE